MYTDKQAKEAIAQKWQKDFEKKISLWWHEAAIKDQAIYNLPYRVLFNYGKNCLERDFMEVPINPYYPYPDIPKEYKPPKWDPITDGGFTSLEEWIAATLKPTGKVDDTGREIMDFGIPAEIQAKIDKWQAEKVKERMGQEYKHIWDLSTPQGQQAWLYWFAIFLLPYADDIPNWNSFDMWGDTKHTKQELEARKRYYMELIEQCKANPEIYKHEVQRKDITDYDKYELDNLSGYMWNDDLSGEPPQIDNALEVMYCERKRFKRYYGDKEYKFEAEYERYGTVYRLEQIIKKLEADKGIVAE